MSDANAQRPRRTTRQRLRRFAGISLLVLIGLAVPVGLCEAFLWIFKPIKFHEWMVWIPDGRIRARARPGQVFETADGAVVRINRLGFRGPDYEWTPPPGTLRLAAFGGSSTFCYHNHGDENTWPGRLQAVLSERLRMPVEVINLGLPGFDSTQSKTNYMFLGRCLHPHVVLQYDSWNDMKYFRSLEKGAHVMAFTVGLPNKPFWQEWARATQIGRYARNAYWNWQKRRLQPAFANLEREGEPANRPVPPAVFDWARRNFEDFAMLAGADGVLAVQISQGSIVHPSTRQIPRGEEELAFAATMFDMSFPVLHQTALEMNRIVEESAARHGAIFVDGYNLVPHDFEHYEDDVHFTDKGCDVFARGVAEALVKDARFMAVVERVRAGAPATRPAG